VRISVTEVDRELGELTSRIDLDLRASPSVALRATPPHKWGGLLERRLVAVGRPAHRVLER